MASIAVNDIIADPEEGRSGRLSFVAVDAKRRLYGVCSRLLAEGVARRRQFRFGDQILAAFPAIEADPPIAGDATALMGAFEFHYAQTFDSSRVPRVTISQFEALGEEVYFYGTEGASSLRIEALNVTLEVDSRGGAMTGFIQLEPSLGSGTLPTDGALLVDARRRAVAVLVGRSETRYFAISIQEILSALRLAPAHEAELGSAPEEIDFEVEAAGDDRPESLGRTGEPLPKGQLADIIGELNPEPAYG